MSKNNKKIAGVLLLIFLIASMIIFGAICILGLISVSNTGNTGYLVLFFACGICFIITLIMTLVFYVLNYNKLIRQKNSIQESLSLIDVQLKLRFDLIPNLVEIVKGYMKHEKNVLESIVSLRSLALQAKEENKKIELANQVVQEMKNLFLVAENYPELKTNKLFLTLMENLRDVENKIAASRRFYNTSINKYNTSVEMFPSNLIASMFGFSTQEMLQIEINEKMLPKVDLSAN